MICVFKQISSIFEYRKLDVHSGTIYLCSWLRHKSCMKAMTLCNNTDCHLECHDAVCDITDLTIAEINLMLCRSCFMMGGFYFHSHILESQHHVTSCILAKIQRTHIQVSCFFVCYGCRIAIIVCVEKKKLTLRIDVAGVSFLLCLFGYSLKNISRAVFVWCTIRPVEIADHSRNFSLLRTPRQDSKRIQHRTKIKIRSLFRIHPCDLFAVDHTLIR